MLSVWSVGITTMSSINVVHVVSGYYYNVINLCCPCGQWVLLQCHQSMLSMWSVGITTMSSIYVVRVVSGYYYNVINLCCKNVKVTEIKDRNVPLIQCK